MSPTAADVAVQWSKRGSWHITGTDAHTLCGRFIRDTFTMRRRDELPGDERTCERCAVIAQKRAQ